MNTDNPADKETASQRFAHEADERQRTMLAELVDFLRHNAKWWLAPIVIVLLVVGALVILSTTAAAPLIYTFF